MMASSGTRRNGSGVTTARSRRRGGAQEHGNEAEGLAGEKTREDWADHANQALARVGSRERITGASLEQQHRDALKNGDERAAARMKYQVPGVHIGPHNVARA